VLRVGVAAALGAVLLSTTAAPLPLVVVSARPSSSVIASRADRVSLARIGAPITLGEYHASWALAPDRSRLAFGISAPGRTSRTGVRVVDLRRWRVSANIETGIAADVLWWPSPRRLVAGLGACICLVQQRGFVVADPVSTVYVRTLGGATAVVDASTGRVVRRLRTAPAVDQVIDPAR